MTPIVRISTQHRDHRYEGLIVCRDHLLQLQTGYWDAPAAVIKEIAADQVAFWNHRCLMCGVTPVTDRVCGNDDCRQPLHPQWPAIYCCNRCALEDA